MWKWSAKRHSRSFHQRQNFLARKRTMRADLKSRDFDRPYSCAHQLQHLRAKRFHHPAHLAISSFGDGDLEKRVARRIANPADDRWPRRAVGEFDSGAEPLELLFTQQLGT